MGRWAKSNKLLLKTENLKRFNVLEDEFHFVLECSMYNELRGRSISKYYWQKPNMFIFIQLLCTEHCKILKNLGVFIEKAFQLRNEIVLLKVEMNLVAIICFMVCDHHAQRQTYLS